MRLLIIADDEQFALKLQSALKEAQLTVDLANSKDQGEFWARTTDYDLAIVEHSESCNAIEICQRIRTSKQNTLLLVATESLSSDEAVALFNCGVDDYTSKFTHLSETVARARALLRRPPAMISKTIKIDDLVLDCNNYSVQRGKKSITLTRKEYGLLEYMLRNQNQVMSRTNLLEHVWDINADLFSNTLETHILNLRKKIELPGRPKLIHTISGRGYKIATER